MLTSLSLLSSGGDGGSGTCLVLLFTFDTFFLILVFINVLNTYLAFSVIILIFTELICQCFSFTLLYIHHKVSNVTLHRKVKILNYQAGYLKLFLTVSIKCKQTDDVFSLQSDAILYLSSIIIYSALGQTLASRVGCCQADIQHCPPLPGISHLRIYNTLHGFHIQCVQQCYKKYLAINHF